MVPPRGLVAFLLLMLVAAAAVAIRFAPGVHPATQPSLQLRFWDADARELAEIVRREDRLLAVALPRAATDWQAEERALRRDVAAWLAMEAQTGAFEIQHDVQARMTLAAVEERLRRLARFGNGDLVRALAIRWGRDALQAFEQVVAAARSQRTAVRELLGQPAAQALNNLAPGFGKLLAETSLENEWQGAGLSLGAKLVVEGFAQQRLLLFGARLVEPISLPADHLGLLLRFRIEAHEGVAVERKLALLGELARSDPAYPAAYVRAVLLARAEKWQPAAAAFELAAALGQDRPLALANAAWCKSKLAN